VNRLRDLAREHGVALTTTLAILLLLAAFGTWQAVRATRAEAEAERQNSLAEQSSQEAAEYAAKLQASEAQAGANATRANDALAAAEESARQARESRRQAEVIAQKLIDAKSREAAARVDAFLPDRKFSKEEIGCLEEQVRAAEANLSIWNARFSAGTVAAAEPLEAKAGFCTAKGRLAWAKGDLLQCQKEYNDAVAAWKQRVVIVRSRYQVGAVGYADVYAAETPEREAEISIGKVRERATRSGIRLLPPVSDVPQPPPAMPSPVRFPVPPPTAPQPPG